MFEDSSGVISHFPHMHTFLEAKMDAEQRYAIKKLVKNKNTRQETLCEIKEVYGPVTLQKTAVTVEQAIFRRL